MEIITMYAQQYSSAGLWGFLRHRQQTPLLRWRDAYCHHLAGVKTEVCLCEKNFANRS